jgi:serine protease Do
MFRIIKSPLSFFLFAVIALFNQAEAAKVKISSPKQMAIGSFADIAENILPSVVNIIITNASSTREFGSGFIVSKDGFIVTNNHVIDEASDISVTLNDDQKFKAKIISVDKKTDLALLKIENDKDLKFVKFGDSTKTRIGDWVLVVGNPYGLGLSVSTGIISAKSRSLNNGKLEEFIQTDAAINNGNSGGPMFNMNGEVIGISSSIISPSGGNIGIGFAIPSSNAEPIIKQLKDQGEVIRGWIGISVQNVNNEIAENFNVEKNRGAFVTEVTKDGPAEQAGIFPTDIILKIDDVEINEMKILPKIISSYPIGKISKFTILRNGGTKILNVKIAKMQEDEFKKIDFPLEKKPSIRASEQILGIGLTNLNPMLKKIRNIDSSISGILVTEVGVKSEAASKGIAAGDIILSVNQESVSNSERMKEIVEESLKNGKKIFLFLKRGEESFGVALVRQ